MTNSNKGCWQPTSQLQAGEPGTGSLHLSASLHDLRAPLRHISGFSKILSEEYGPSLAPEAQHHLQRIQEGVLRMGMLVDDLLNLARVGRRDLSLRVAGLTPMVDELITELEREYEGREIQWKIGELPFVECDPGLMKQVFQNLLSNAIKFTRPRPQAVIEVGHKKDENGFPVVFVRDNGVGFSMKYAEKLFGVFQRLHRIEDFEGTGVGLATVQRIIQKHGGRVWAEAELATQRPAPPPCASSSRRSGGSTKIRSKRGPHDSLALEPLQTVVAEQFVFGAAEAVRTRFSCAQSRYVFDRSTLAAAAGAARRRRTRWRCRCSRTDSENPRPSPSRGASAG